MTDYVIITTTTDSAEAAQRLADSAVGERLAACAHVRETDATYWWEGEVQHDHEWEVQLKTRSARVEQLAAHILATHSYDLPQIIVTPIDGGHQPYLDWIEAEASPR